MDIAPSRFRRLGTVTGIVMVSLVLASCRPGTDIGSGQGEIFVYGPKTIHYLTPVRESKVDSGTPFHFRFDMGDRASGGALAIRTRSRLQPGDSLAISADSTVRGAALGSWTKGLSDPPIIGDSGYVKVHRSPIGDILDFKFWGQGRADTIPLRVGGSFYKMTRMPTWMGRAPPAQ